MIKKINFEELDLKGAFKIQPFYATDERGGFVKDYNIDVFKSNGIAVSYTHLTLPTTERV